MIYDISYETLTDLKASRIRFDQIDGFIRTYVGSRYLKLKILKYNLFGLRLKTKKNIEWNDLPVYNDKYIKTKIRTFGDTYYLQTYLDNGTYKIASK